MCVFLIRECWSSLVVGASSLVVVGLVLFLFFGLSSFLVSVRLGSRGSLRGVVRFFGDSCLGNRGPGFQRIMFVEISQLVGGAHRVTV